MAVSLNAPSTANLRCDFPISDAAMSRNAGSAQSGQQDSQFDDMLTHLSEKTELRSVSEDIDSGKYDVPTLEDLEKAGIIAIDKDTGRVSAPNTEKLAAKLIEDGIDEENIPIELLTPELLKAISALRGNASEETDAIDEILPTIEKPVKEKIAEKLADSGILEELAQLLMAANSENTDNSELAQINPEEIVRQVAEAVAAADAADETGFEQVQDAVASDNAKTDVTAKTDDTNVFAQIVDSHVKVVDSHVKAQQNTENQPQDNGNSSDFTEQSVPEELKNLGTEKLDVLKKAFADGEISKAEVKTTPIAEENTQTVPEKTAEKPEFIEQKPRVESAKSAVSEELEMLRNAKAKPVSEETSVPVRAENPLGADSPIVFRREDGEVSVKPSEIIGQTMKAVMAAVSEKTEQTEYSLVLNPEELGRITVKMTRAADGAVSVTVAAENAHTQRILEQHSELMQSNLKDSGVNLESWQTVHESQQETRAGDYNGSSKNPYFTQQDNNGGDDDGEQSFADIIAAM